jgi:hypothetical protein
VPAVGGGRVADRLAGDVHLEALFVELWVSRVHDGKRYCPVLFQEGCVAVFRAAAGSA